MPHHGGLRSPHLRRTGRPSDQSPGRPPEGAMTPSDDSSGGSARKAVMRNRSGEVRMMRRAANRGQQLPAEDQQSVGRRAGPVNELVLSYKLYDPCVA